MSQQFYHIEDDLLVKYLLGEATEPEREEVYQWINRSDANKKQYEDLKRIWEESRKLFPKNMGDEEAAWQRFKKKAGIPLHEKSSSGATLWWRIAALFILVVGGAYLAFRLLDGEQVSDKVVVSGKGPLTDTLPDNSIVTLNKNTTLKYPSHFTGKTRPIILDGEAFFNVTPDKEKPFVISVNDLTIRVVGTSFNVRSVRGTIEVIVETGIVQVTKKGQKVELRPAESLKVEQSDSLLVKTKVTGKLYNYYLSREFVCDDTPLWKLVEVLNEAYNANIVIEKPELRNLRLTTTFHNESLDKILLVVSETFGIELKKESTRVVLK